MIRQLKKPINIVLLLVLVFELSFLASTVYADLTGTEGLAIDLSSAGAGTDFTIAFDPTEITGGTTWDDGGEASVIWTWDLSAGDPSVTFGNGVVNVSSGTLQQGGAAVYYSGGTDIVHEDGGLEADVSGYSGFVGINGGSTLDGDTLAELLTAMGDVTKFFTDDDIVGPSADPDVDALGELGIDTDGANEPNDVILRTADTGGDTQYALAQVLKSIQGTVITPNDLADATRDACPVWENNTGMTFTITMIRAWADTDDTDVNVETYDSDWDNNATVDALAIATDEVANFSVEETTITAATITAGSLIVLDFDDTDDPGWVKFNIMGYFNADVN